MGGGTRAGGVLLLETRIVLPAGESWERWAVLDGEALRERAAALREERRG